MTYDPVRRRTVLFSGQAATDSFPADTWTWDGERWSRMTSGGPAGRVHHSLAWDPAGRRVILFGGIAPGEHRPLGDTWAWNGTAWRLIAPDAPPRTHARLTGSPIGILLLGGLRTTTPMVLGADGWRVLGAEAGPAARYLPAAAFDPRRHRVVLFGGGNAAGSDLFADTWEFDGIAWSLIAAGPPAGR